MKRATCDIVIPVWNQLNPTKICIESIKRNTHTPYRLILIDNASGETTRDYLAQLDRQEDNITLIRNEENLGFIKAVNKGLKISNAPYVCIMNNDTVAGEKWLAKMIDLAESRCDIGIVNPQSESPGKLSVDEYAELLAKNKGKYIETNQCLGFCMLIKREVIDKIGYLDEIYGIGGFDDTEFSIKAYKEGYKCVAASDAYVHHKWHTSFKKAGNREELVRINEKIFFDRWGKYLRLAYPILNNSNHDFFSDIYTSLGLAREWNWVHAWVNEGNTPKVFNSISLPKHQSMRLFYLGKNRLLFFIKILFKLIERSLKRKKHFDAVLVSDFKLFRNLSRFKRFFKTPLFYIKKEQLPIDIKDEASWIKRANFIASLVRKESK